MHERPSTTELSGKRVTIENDRLQSCIRSVSNVDNLDLFEPEDLRDPCVQRDLERIVSDGALQQSYRDKAQELLNAARGGIKK